MGVKFCGECGKPLKEQSKFCGNCGWKVVDISHNQNYNTAGPSQSYKKNYGQGAGSPTHTSGYGGQNQFEQFSGQFGNEANNAKTKRAGYGLGIVILMVIIAAVAFIGIRMLKNGSIDLNVGNPMDKIPAVGKNAGIDPADLSGGWVCEFTTINIKMNGEVNPAYSVAVGKTTNANMLLDIQSDGKGTATFHGRSHGYDFNSAAVVEYRNDKIEITYSDPNQSAELKYTGDVINEEDGFSIEGKFETTYAIEGTEDELTMTGIWNASISKGSVPKGTDTSKAKKDVTVDDLTGMWIGKMVYEEVKNLDRIPEATEEDKEIFRKLIGMEVDCSILFEGNEIVFTITDPTGETSDLEDMPPITLKDGVFTSAISIDDSDGEGKMNIHGVVTEQDGQLNIEGNMLISMSITEEFAIEFNISYKVKK